MHCCANRCIGSASSATHWRTETGVAFARAGRASIETAIAFADEKELFLVWFSGAEVMLVSRVRVWGRAVVMVVSCWPASVAAKVSLVSTPPRVCVLCAKKFALRTKNGPKLTVYGMPGELFRGTAAERSVLGEFCRTTTQVRPTAWRPSSQIEQGTDLLGPPRADGHEKSTPEGVLGRNAEPPPMDRTEGGRCAPEGTRTPNLLNRNQMLYPLSYGRFAVWLGISLHALRQDAKSRAMA